jgi:hypothetical protein
MGWNSEGGLHWKIEESQGPVWEHKDSIMTTWKSRVRSDSRKCTIKILVDQVKIIHDSLATYGIAKF